MRPAVLQHSEPVPERRERHLRAVPYHVPPPPSGFWKALAIVFAVLLTSGATYVWQHGQETDQAGRAVLLRTQVAQLQRQAGSYAEEIGALQQRIYGYRVVSKDLRAQLQETSKQQQGLARHLLNVRARLSETVGRLNTLVGPPLPDGRSVGYLYAVGATQEPARVVFDLARFTADNEISGILNTSPRWRILEVSSQAAVTLHTWRAQTVTVGIHKLGFIFSSPLTWNDPMTRVPYVVTVNSGIVEAIEEYQPAA